MATGVFTAGTQRYRVMEAFLATGRRCCMLTATPRNQSAWDVYHQIKQSWEVKPSEPEA